MGIADREVEAITGKTPYEHAKEKIINLETELASMKEELLQTCKRIDACSGFRITKNKNTVAIEQVITNGPWWIINSLAPPKSFSNKHEAIDAAIESKE